MFSNLKYSVEDEIQENFERLNIKNDIIQVKPIDMPKLERAARRKVALPCARWRRAAFGKRTPKSAARR